MKHLILATVAVMSLATAGSAFAAQPQVKQDQLAAAGIQSEQGDTDAHGTQTQYAAAGGATVQLAASGMQYVQRSHGDYQM